MKSVFKIMYFYLQNVHIFCQNVPPEVVSRSTFPQGLINSASKPSSEPQLMSTLLSLASNGAFPERSGPIVQTIVQPEKPVGMNILDDRPQTLNLISFQPKIPTCNPTSNMLFSSPIPSASVVPIQSIQPSTVAAPIPLNSFLTIPQCSKGVQSYGNVVQNAPTLWQLPQPLNNGLNYVPVNPITYTEASPLPINLQISPPCSSLPEINANSGLLEILSRSNLVGVQEPNVITSEGDNIGFPLNLQINLPSQSIPAPRITVVSASPQTVTSSNTEEPSLFPPFGFLPPPPPLIMRKSRSSWKKILPIILIALFNDRCCCGGGCSCCNCNPDTNPIPIPYPIPIPVNNPIINNSKSSCSCRKREYRDHEGNKTK